MKQIRDPLYGYIQISEEEKEVLDSPDIQRLRRIRQLGLSSLTYPSATHTRFEHSLGVMHLASEFADSFGLDEERRRELRLAGLFHDSGHGPFSHASEMVAENEGLSHEDLSCQIIDKLEHKYSPDKRRIKKIIRGELEIGNAVAGEIDADRIDYLARDSHKSGLEHGQIDSDTIIKSAEIDSRRIVFDSKAIQSIESLFTARFHMTKSLYKHRAVKIAEKMLQRSLENYLKQRNSLGEMMNMDDYQAHCKLLEAEGPAKKLYARIKDRKLFKKAVVWDEDRLSRKALESLENRIQEPCKIGEQIAEEAGIESHKVIIDKPQAPEIQEIDVKIKKNGEVKDLEALSPIPEALKDSEWRTVAMEVYCPKESIEEVQKASEKVLKDYTNILSG